MREVFPLLEKLSQDIDDSVRMSCIKQIPEISSACPP